MIRLFKFYNLLTCNQGTTRTNLWICIRAWLWKDPIFTILNQLQRKTVKNRRKLNKICILLLCKKASNNVLFPNVKRCKNNRRIIRIVNTIFGNYETLSTRTKWMMAIFVWRLMKLCNLKNKLISSTARLDNKTKISSDKSKT